MGSGMCLGLSYSWLNYYLAGGEYFPLDQDSLMGVPFNLENRALSPLIPFNLDVWDYLQHNTFSPHMPPLQPP